MKTILITGCSSGYGLATARHFHAMGWNVVATMRQPRPELLPQSERMRIVALDVTNPASVASAIAAAGPIDALVNNAGIGVVGGLMRGERIADWVDSITEAVPIEQFPRRFAAVATDLDSGKAVLLDKGAAGAAVQASAAVPGANVPVAYAGGHLVDGGIASLVPVRFAKALGADVVIAVDIYCAGPQSTAMAAPAILLRAMRVQSCLVAAQEMADADVLIAPPVNVPGMSAKEEQEHAILVGYEAARAAMPRIQSRLAYTARGAVAAKL